MKNKVVRVCCFVLFFVAYLYLLSGCKKPVAVNQNNGTTTDAPAGNTCNSSFADAENIAIMGAEIVR